MLETIISQAHVNAVSVCQGFPPGIAYEECYTWAVADFMIGNQATEERLEFLIILASVTAIYYTLAVLHKLLSVLESD